MSKKRAEPPPDHFGGYPGDDQADDQDDDQDDDDQDDDTGVIHTYPEGDVDLNRPPSRGERRIIELTLREIGAAGIDGLHEVTARASGMIERTAKTLHDGIDEVFSALAEAHTDADSPARTAQGHAREEAHRTVDKLVDDLRGEGDNEPD